MTAAAAVAAWDPARNNDQKAHLAEVGLRNLVPALPASETCSRVDQAAQLRAHEAACIVGKLPDVDVLRVVRPVAQVHLQPHRAAI